MSGEEQRYLWEIALSGKVLSTPIERKNEELILICDDRRLYSLNIDKGTINWKVKPGGRLDFLAVSPDGSIIVTDDKNIYSFYSNGELRWNINFSEGFNSNLTISDRGDIIFSSNNSLYLVDRFGKKNIILKNFKSKLISVLENSLITYVEGNNLFAVTYSGKTAWSIGLQGSPDLIKSFDDSLYLVYNSGIVDTYSLSGTYNQSWETTNTNIKSISLNLNNDLLISGNYGTTLVTNSSFLKNNSSLDIGLYYSNGTLIQSHSDWIIHGVKINSNLEYYPSGQIQTLDRTISLSQKTVWGEENDFEYYRNIILSGNRTLQNQLLKKIEDEINSDNLLDTFPNFYDILLLASSKRNVNQDIRLEAYRIIGLSKDISFLPYLVADLEDETSYIVIPYIFYALGQIGVDRTGGVISLINTKIDNYYDEQMVLSGLQALYNINNYTNGEFTYKVFAGIEKILNSGYSNNIQNQCYDIIKKIK